MWGLFIGLAIGVLQLLGAYKLIPMIMGGKTSARIIGGVLFLLKIAAIIFILYMLSTISLEILIWTAVGTLIGLSSASLIVYKQRKKA